MGNEIFFYASKLIWWAIRPETIVVMLAVLIFIALLRNWRRLALWLSGLSAVCLVFLSIFPLAEPLSSSLEFRFPVAPEPEGPVAGIIVLGGGERGQFMDLYGIPAVNEQGDRLLNTIVLARKYPDALVIHTGGSARIGLNRPMPEAEVAESLFDAAGIAKSRQVLEGTSRNTAENAANTKVLLGARMNRPGTWILVTSAYHMPRSVGVFCKAGFRNILPYPVDHRVAGLQERAGWKLAENLVHLNQISKEWLGLVVYAATGRTTGLWPEVC